jgi:histidinol-phosphate aminotransferase
MVEDLVKELLRPQIKNLQPYVSKAVPGCVRLDANENPLPWPEGLREELMNANIAFNRYPDGEANELKEALANFTGIPKEGILTGNGSYSVNYGYFWRGRESCCHSSPYLQYV